MPTLTLYIVYVLLSGSTAAVKPANTLFMRAVLEGVRKVSPEFFQQKINVCVGVHVMCLGIEVIK